MDAIIDYVDHPAAAGTPAQPASMPMAGALEVRLDRYEQERDEREQFVEALRLIIMAQLRQNGIETALVEGRVKATHSYARHLAENQDDDRQDLTALRAVLLYSAQTEEAVTAISSLFGETSDDFRDESDSSADLEPWEFAYRSRHLKFKPTETLAARHSINIPHFLLDEWAEIQVRSLAAHLWSAIDHKIRYKTPFPLKSGEARTLFMVAAQLEAIDRELDSIHISLTARVGDGGLNVLAGSYDHAVSRDGIRAMLYGDPSVVRALAVAQAYGWTFVYRDGHEHIEGGYVGSPADNSERESCDSLKSLVANDGIALMRVLRETITAVVTPSAVQRLAHEATSRGYAAVTYPADLIALLYQTTRPTPRAAAYVSWQPVIDAIREETAMAGGK